MGMSAAIACSSRHDYLRGEHAADRACVAADRSVAADEHDAHGAVMPATVGLEALRWRATMRARLGRHDEACADFAALRDAARARGDARAELDALLDEATARDWAREQAAPTFTADPFASRRGQLPGGDGRGRFRMKEPLSPQKVLQMIGGMAGGPGYSQSPCPRIASNLGGLLTATSDQERELLEEELRRDREYCRP